VEKTWDIWGRGHLTITVISKEGGNKYWVKWVAYNGEGTIGRGVRTGNIGGSREEEEEMNMGQLRTKKYN